MRQPDRRMPKGPLARRSGRDPRLPRLSRAALTRAFRRRASSSHRGPIASSWRVKAMTRTTTLERPAQKIDPLAEAIADAAGVPETATAPDIEPAVRTTEAAT